MPGAMNSVTVADSVKAHVAALERTLPPGVRLLLDRDESALHRRSGSDDAAVCVERDGAH